MQIPGVWLCFRHAIFFLTLPKQFFLLLFSSVRWRCGYALHISADVEFTWETSHRLEFHTRMTSWFRIAFTWWLGHFILRLYEGPLHIDILGMRCPFQSTGRSTSHWNEWSFRVYAIPLRNFAPVQQPGWTQAGVTRASMTFCWCCSW